MGLIHMNGRVYDPILARFISADPIIQAPTDMQSYNRYAYVRNNPLAYTDPSGYSWLSKEVGRWGDDIQYEVDHFYDSVWKKHGMDILQAAFAIAACSGGPAACAGYFAAVEATKATLKTPAGQRAVRKFSKGLEEIGVDEKHARGLSSLVISYAINSAYSAGWDYATGAGEGVADVEGAATNARMSEASYDVTDADIGKLTIDGFTLTDIHTHRSGLKAALFEGANSKIVAFAGTDLFAGGGVDLIANFKQAFGFTSAQYEAGIKYALSISGDVSFTGHSLGGGIATAAAIITGGSAMVFNSAGVHSNTLRGFSRSNGAIKYFYSTHDVIRTLNVLSPASVPGTAISMGHSGLHGMAGVCSTMGC
jgi:RHS repeat-associated core domain